MLSRLIATILSSIQHRPAHASAGTLEDAYSEFSSGNFDKAQLLCETIIARHAKAIDAAVLLARIHVERGRFPEAEQVLLQALRIHPNDPELLNALGNVFSLASKPEQAITQYEVSLRRLPHQPWILLNLAKALLLLDRLDEAQSRLEQALALQPDLLEALKLLTPLLLSKGQDTQAFNLVNAARSSHPKDPDLLNGLGFLYQRQYQPLAALKLYDAALELDSENYEIWDNRGTVLQELMRLDDAIASFEKAIALRPDHPVPRWHKSLNYLLRHQFSLGWPDYELRLYPEQKPAPRIFPGTRWQGEPLTGKTILIYAEQGIGDEIMFSSCIPDMQKMGCNIILECATKLGPIFSRSFPNVTIYGTDPQAAPTLLQDIGSYDYQIPIGSLPQFLRREIRDFPKHHGYLRADPEAVRYWRQRLEALGPGPYIGISWRGGTRSSRQQIRSTTLEDWLPILHTPGAHFVSLQYDQTENEIATLEARHGVKIHSWSEALSDYDQTAALVVALDQVISVCTALIHLTGALGKPAWVMVPFSPEWRYGATGESLPWYPSVQLFRQSEWGVWSNTVNTIASALRNISTQSRT